MVLALFCLTPSGIMSRMSCCAQHTSLVRTQFQLFQEVSPDRQDIMVQGGQGAMVAGAKVT